MKPFGLKRNHYGMRTRRREMRIKHNAKYIDRGLLIKSPWVEDILQGRKTWEIRGLITHIRGKIALIRSG